MYIVDVKSLLFVCKYESFVGQVESVAAKARFLFSKGQLRRFGAYGGCMEGILVLKIHFKCD